MVRGPEPAPVSPERFAALWCSLAPIGRAGSDGGYLRYTWSPADLAAREWFVEEALDRDLTVETDRNGNLTAWWGDPAAGDAVLTGSHLDSVPHGGGYDGALGVVSGLLAVDALRSDAGGVAPPRAIGVAVFVEEEGARFGVPCLGTRLLTGAVEPQTALALRDADGVSFAEAMAAAELDPTGVGPDPAALARLGAFVELHIEQGRALVDLAAPVGVAQGIWPHGRWRLEITGEANHAGTTRLVDRRDPMVTCAHLVLGANQQARERGAQATVGRLAVTPNATNAVPAGVTAWLDARAADEPALRALVDAVAAQTLEQAGRDGTGVEFTEESLSPAVVFDPGLRERLRELLDAPVLATAAGHDAGVLAAHVPTAMLFVRNPTGVSHSPAEHASDVDCALGVEALARTLRDLAWR